MSLLQVANDLVTVSASVLPARDMDPVILAIRCFENQLIEFGMGFEEIEPLVGNFHVSVLLVV